MKKILLFGFLILASCENKKEIHQVVEISCGQCQFEIAAPMGCDPSQFVWTVKPTLLMGQY